MLPDQFTLVAVHLNRYDNYCFVSCRCLSFYTYPIDTPTNRKEAPFLKSMLDYYGVFGQHQRIFSFLTAALEQVNYSQQTNTPWYWPPNQWSITRSCSGCQHDFFNCCGKLEHLGTFNDIWSGAELLVQEWMRKISSKLEIIWNQNTRVMTVSFLFFLKIRLHPKLKRIKTKIKTQNEVTTVWKVTKCNFFLSLRIHPKFQPSIDRRWCRC